MKTPGRRELQECFSEGYYLLRCIEKYRKTVFYCIYVLQNYIGISYRIVNKSIIAVM